MKNGNGPIQQIEIVRMNILLFEALLRTDIDEATRRATLELLSEFKDMLQKASAEAASLPPGRDRGLR